MSILLALPASIKIALALVLFVLAAGALHEAVMITRLTRPSINLDEEGRAVPKVRSEIARRLASDNGVRRRMTRFEADAQRLADAISLTETAPTTPGTASPSKVPGAVGES